MSSYRLARLADTDLDEIADYIADHSPTAAIRQIERLHAKFSMLAMHPLLGQVCDDLRRNLRMFSVGSYVIFYTPCDDGIEVERVIHGARDITSLF
jgi:toxin ParE1/3/4